MRVRLVTLVALAVAGAVAATFAVAALGSTASSTTFRVRLTGRAETPIGDRGGRGTAKITVKSIGVGLLEVHDPQDRREARGGPHPQGQGGRRRPGRRPARHRVQGGGLHARPRAAVAKAIMSSPRGFYVNVHNAKHPAGALRSQL